MPSLRLILALHHHQPLGQQESTLEQTYETRYRPFLELMEKHIQIPFALHTSGPLLEWLLERHPEYIDRLRRFVARGQVEVLGGGQFEPVMTMIPERDRVGQIRAYTRQLHEVFKTHVRGIWLAERVWEQNLVTAIVLAGMEYTILGNHHFEQSDSSADGPFGYFLTEDQGHLLKIFPACQTMRDGIAFADPDQYLAYLKSVTIRDPGATVVFADDGEKFGGWSNTSDHVDRQAWLARFCDLLVAAQGDWLDVTTFATAADRTLPLGKAYLVESASGWRNSLVRNPESDEMYARMLGVSERLAAALANDESDPDYLEVARDELFRGQCHSAYGESGLNQPGLRNAVYRHLIAADNALDLAQQQTGPYARASVGDFNLDARLEVRLENDCLITLVRPASGGHIYALDLREPLVSLLATLGARPQDGQPRKALVDHIYPVEATLADVIACGDFERGDFALGTYHAKLDAQSNRVALIMDRIGRAGDISIKLRKSIALSAGESSLSVRYEIEKIPADACLHFAVEINLAGLDGSASQRYYSDPSGEKLGLLNSRLDLPHSSGLSVLDESLEFSVSLAWSQAAGLWCFPIETVNQSKRGLERMQQSSAVIPHWHVTPDDDGRWCVSIRWGLENKAVACPSSGAGEARPALVIV